MENPQERLRFRDLRGKTLAFKKCDFLRFRGGFLVWTCPSQFVLLSSFWDFPVFLGDFPDLSGIFPNCPFPFHGVLTAPMKCSPERVCDTSPAFPKKNGNLQVWKPSGFPSPKGETIKPGFL